MCLFTRTFEQLQGRFGGLAHRLVSCAICVLGRIRRCILRLSPSFSPRRHSHITSQIPLHHQLSPSILTIEMAFAFLTSNACVPPLTPGIQTDGCIFSHMSLLPASISLSRATSRLYLCALRRPIAIARPSGFLPRRDSCRNPSFRCR